MAVNHHNSCYLTEHPVVEVDPSIYIVPFFKVPLKQMVPGVVASDSQKCSIVFVPVGKLVNANVYLDLLR